MKYRWSGALVGVWMVCLPAFCADDIVLWYRNYEQPRVFEMIELAAELSRDKYGDYTLISSQSIEQGRAFANLVEGRDLNVMVAGSTLEREAAADTIYIPLDRGLLGFRVCLKTQDAPAYANINTVEDFRRENQLIGVGSHWPDKRILTANKLTTVASPVYENLFAMLEKRRFDCFARSLNELDVELQRHQDQGFVVEPYVALVYAYADLTFVSKSFPRVRERLEYGLRRAIEDKSFFEVFDKHYLDIMRKYQFYNRKLLFLKNPELSPKAKRAINQYGIASFALGF